MKKSIFIFLGLFLFLSCSFLGCERNETVNFFPKNSITVFCTPELSGLTANWASVFATLNPDVKIDVIDVTGSSIVENLENGRNLGFTTDAHYRALDGISTWNEVIGREVIVPVVNAKNPFLEDISKQGISPEKLIQLVKDDGMTSWGDLLDTRQNVPVHLYVIDDASISAGMARLSETDQIAISGTKVDDGDDLISAVEKDLYSIGLCRITNVTDLPNGSIHEKVEILPIDKNGNGKIDFKENIYDDLNVFSRGVWIGKYPRALFNNIYAVSAAQPKNKNEVAFLKWILNNGQTLLDNYGYSDLEHNERLAKIKLIDNYEINNPVTAGIEIPREPLFSNIYFIALLILISIVLFLTISGYILRGSQKEDIQDMRTMPGLIFSEGSIRSPQGLYYAKTHTWAFMDKDGMVKIGIDDFLQHVTGPITNVKLKYAGEKIRKGKPVLSIVQEGKQLDICAPVSGIIREQNKSLSANTSIINISPYSEGWIYKIEPTNWLKDIQFLFMGNNYREWLRGEFARLKEFFADSLKPETVQYAHILQDGGELKDGLLEEFGPEVWEEFQTNFIDEST